MKYRKTVRTGKFAKAGVDYKENDLVTILNEGDEVEGTYGPGIVFKVHTPPIEEHPSGQELSMRFNATSINNMIDAFGDDSKEWIGKKVKVWRILQNVQGKMVRVTYLSHPDADINEAGDFSIPNADAPAAEDSGIEEVLEDIV